MYTSVDTHVIVVHNLANKSGTACGFQTLVLGYEMWYDAWLIDYEDLNYQ